jgi:ABC-type transport system involved in cytochrome bd biosynthesis fused ATPase/permease subunit
MKPYSVEMLLTIISTFLKHVVNIVAAGIVAFMTALAMEGQLREKFAFLFGWLCVCIITKALMYYGEMWFGHDIAYKVLKDFRIKLYSKIEKLSPAFMLENHTGKIGSTLMCDIELLEWFLAHTFGTAIVALVITLLLLFALAQVHIILSALMLLFAVLVFSVPFIFQKKSDKQGKEVQENRARAASTTIEAIHGLRELLTLNSIETYKERNRASIQKFYDAQIIYGRRQGTETMLMQIFVGIFTVSIMGVAALFVSQNIIDFKVYPVVVLLAALLFSPIVDVCSVARNMGLVFASANRIQSVFDTLPTVEDKAASTFDCFTDSIIFENVGFGYTVENLVLRDISFEIKKGETVALIGPSGAGKSTCVSLLLRYWNWCRQYQN